MKDEIIDTDVLVIGAGGAGVRAAIEAYKMHADVKIVTKYNLPSGSTTIAMGLIQAAYAPGDNTDVHFKDTIIGGAYINNQKLVRVLVNEAIARVKELDEFGTEILKERGKYKLFPMSGSTYPRSIVTADPYKGGFMKGLVEEVQRLGVHLFKNVMITNLFKTENVAVGATGINLKTGEFLVFKSKSIVLATGGAGQIYPLTTNPKDIVGDGYILAYNAGLALIDMEFVQSRACIINPKALRGTPPPGDGLVSVGGRFYNALCERYMKKYDPVNAERVTRDLVGIRTFMEIKAGRGTPLGGVYNDLSNVPEEEIRAFTKFLDACQSEGIDPYWQPLEWAPGAHHFMGGVKINEKCETNIQGLYACGEVAGGVHGANRIAANALTDVLVFGARAGKFAAEYALSKSKPEPNHEKIEAERSRILTIYERDEGVDATDIRRNVRDVTGRYVGISKTEIELLEAINMLDKIRKDKLPKIYIKGEKTYFKLGEALETINLITLSEILARTALMRTESRGAHHREDHLQRDDENWLKNIIIQLDGNKMKLHTMPSILTELRPI